MVTARIGLTVDSLETKIVYTFDSLSDSCMGEWRLGSEGRRAAFTDTVEQVRSECFRAHKMFRDG